MNPQKDKLKYIIIAFLVIIVVTAIYLFVIKNGKDEMLFSGVVEVTTYNMSFEARGRIEKIYAKEGQAVKKGDLLAILDQEPFQAQYKRARAKLAGAEANLDNLLAGPRPNEIEQARAQLRGARAELEKLQNGPTANELEQARASMLSAWQQYNLMKSGYRQEDVSSAGNQLESARSNMETVKRNYERYRNLYEIGAVSAQSYETHKNQYEVALANYENARQQYKKMQSGFRPPEVKQVYEQYKAQKARYDEMLTGTRPEIISKAKTQVDYWENQVQLMLEGPRKQEVKAARERVQEAEAGVELATNQLKNSKIHAPADGVVVTVNFEDSETIGPGIPVVSINDLANPWVYIFLPETLFGKVNLNEPAVATVDSFPGEEFQGKVTRIYEKAEFTPKFIQTHRERVNLVFRTKVQVENPGLKLKPGMPADVVIKTNEKD
ncbi:MAG: efflux RND transporter periplasmic adaptor subunit [Vulcanimicrobiota bacterium]